MIKNKTMPYNITKKHVEKKTPHARDRPFAKKAKECVKKAGNINLKKHFCRISHTYFALMLETCSHVFTILQRVKPWTG